MFTIEEPAKCKLDSVLVIALLSLSSFFFPSSCFDFNLRKSDHYYINFKRPLVNLGGK